MSRVAAQKTWQQIWIRPEVRPRANPTRSDPARVRARRRGRARRGNGTLARSATPPDESPPPPPTATFADVPAPLDRRCFPSSRRSAARARSACSSAAVRSPALPASGAPRPSDERIFHARPRHRFPSPSRASVAPPRRAAGPRRAAESRAAAAFDDDDDARGVRSNLETRAAREGPRDRRRADRSIRPSPRSPPSLSNAIRTFKDARKNECIPEDAKRVKEGISWRENLVRRTVRGMNPQIFPGLNDWMSK